MFLVFTLYLIVFHQEADVFALNRVIADVSILLIGYSISVGVIHKIFRFGGYFNARRRELGLLGFYLAIVHGALTFLILDDALATLTSADNLSGFLIAVLTLLLLFGMTIISVDAIKSRLGTDKWRALLSLGIYVYGLGIAHAAIKVMPHLTNWLASEDEWMPLSVIVIGLAALMFILKMLSDKAKVL